MTMKSWGWRRCVAARNATGYSIHAASEAAPRRVVLNRDLIPRRVGVALRVGAGPTAVGNGHAAGVQPDEAADHRSAQSGAGTDHHYHSVRGRAAGVGL